MGPIKHSNSVQLREDGAIVSIRDLLEGLDHAVYAQHNEGPLNNSHPAFRVKIVQLGEGAVVGVGISASPIVQEIENDEKEQESEHKLRDALMYHSDDGVMSSPSRDSKNNCSAFGEGDVITCVIEQLSAHKSLVCVWKNETIQYRRWVTIQDKDLFPTINAWWGPAELEVDWLSSSVPPLSMTNLSQWMSSDNIKIEGDSLSATNEKKACAQSPCGFQQDSSMYFEMSLESLGESQSSEENEPKGPMICLTSATWSPDEGLPGKAEFSVAYDTAKGKITNSGQTSKGKNLGDAGKCKTGDVIGCGILHFEADKSITDTQMVVAYFTRNQTVLHHCNVTQSTGGFYPTCAFVSKGSCVRLNMTASAPELPDKANWLAKAKRALDFPGLGDFDGYIPEHNQHKHEEGKTEGSFRFSEPIGCPTSDTITPRSKLDDGKLLQLLKTITPSEPYFTIKIEELDEKSMVCVGISRGGQSCGSIPGSLIDSAGYSSNGHILMGMDGRFEADEFEKGDEVAVYVQFLDLSKVVQFFKNGRLMGQCIIKGTNKDIFPSLGFRGQPATVTVTWPSSRPGVPEPNTYSKDNLDVWLKSPGIVVNGDKITCEEKTRHLWGKIVISPQPMSQKWSYFEVEVNSKNFSTDTHFLDKAPTIGLTNFMRPAKYRKIINNKDARDIRYYCRTNTVGYMDYLDNQMKSLDGYIEKGDRIGWGIIFPSCNNIPNLTRQVVIVYCAINGNVMFHKPMEQPGGGFFPVITLYRYGEEVSMSIKGSVPRLPDKLKWYEEADAFRLEVDQKRKAAGQYKETAADRRARPASASKRTDNHLNKHTVYIHCDPQRYNEATHIQARLDKKGFMTHLLPEDKLNSSNIDSLIDNHVSSCTAVVCCMGPEISETKQMGLVLDYAQKRSKPVLPFILESFKWPPEGALQNEWQKLVMHKIETSGDFDWAIEQIEDKTLNLKDKGYNGKEIRVSEGKGAKMFYSDAQKGNKTTNQASDPNALKKAMAEADRSNLQSIGSDDFQEPGGRGDHGASGGGRSFSFTSLKEPKKNYDEPRRPHTSQGGRINQSKTCTLL